MNPMRRLPAVVASSLLLAAPLATRPAGAQPPDPAVLERVAHHAQAFEELVRKSSYTFDVTVQRLDGDGKVDETKRKHARWEYDGRTGHQVVLSCTKDGKDTTAEEQEKAREREADAAKKKDDDEWHVPFIASEQPKYVFDQVAVDPRNPARVKIAFRPKDPGEHSLEGAAWIDTDAGTVVSAGMRLVNPPTFVDWVHVTVEIAAPTPVGPAPSRLTFEGKGGFLIIHRHFKGELTLGDYRLAGSARPVAAAKPRD